MSSTIEIIYTSTTTFYGDPADYTPPYPPIVTTPYCPWPKPSLPHPSVPAESGWPSHQRPLPTSTFVTTDKNPSVVFSRGPPPAYTDPGDPGLHRPGHHTTAIPKDGDDNQPVTDAPDRSPKPTFTVTAGPDYVVIGDTTFSGIKPTQTSTVVAGGGTFTIFPTAVIGEGVTVARPAAPATTDLAPSPTSTNLAGLPISVSGSVIEIDGRTLTIPPKGTTTLINGENVSLGRGTAVVAGSKTFTWADAPVLPTSVRVVGGETLTATGPTILVLHSTTITYGPGIDKSITTVDDDIITIAPSGIIVHGSTLGNPSADASDITHAVVGGVTITRLGSSIIAIDGHTYTVGSDTDPFTTSFAAGLVTIGPQGVVFNKMTYGLDDDSVVATFEAEGTRTSDLPVETGSSGSSGSSSNSSDDEDSNEDDEDDAAGSVRPSVLFAGLSVAFGIWAFI
ncbi:hypothetical protein ACO1O0_006273 [Amphichorda felina]